MTNEKNAAAPYRNGVRVQPDEPMEPLPDFLTVRYDELVTRDQADWEAHVKPPEWWVRHVKRHTLERGSSGYYGGYLERRILAPDATPFRRSLLWTVSLGVTWVISYAIAKPMQGINPALAAALACGIATGIATIVTMTGKGDPLWSFKHVSLPPLSLYLTLKERVAWGHWRTSGKRWSFADWSTKMAIERLATAFREDTLQRHAKDLMDLRARETKCRSEAENARLRIEAYASQRKTLAPNNAIIGEQLTRSIKVETDRAAMLISKAERLAALAADGEQHLEALKQAVDTYESLQYSRQELREAKSLDQDDTNDLTQQEIVREEHLKLREILRRVEAVFHGAPARTTATDEDELSARIREASERTAARP